MPITPTVKEAALYAIRRTLTSHSVEHYEYNGRLYALEHVVALKEGRTLFQYITISHDLTDASIEALSEFLNY